MKIDIDIDRLHAAGLAAESAASAEPGLLRAQVLRAQLLRLATRGLNAREAAQIVGYAHHTVQKYYREPDFQATVRRRVEHALGDGDERVLEQRMTLADRLRQKSETAFTVLCEMLDDPATHPGYRMKIAQDFLDRNEETQGGSIVTRRTVDPEQLRHAAQVAAEMDSNVVPIKKVG